MYFQMDYMEFGFFIRYLSACVGSSIDEHLKFLIIQISKGVNHKKFKDEVWDTLETLEKNGVC